MSAAEVEQIIQQAKAEQWTELDLSDRGLTALPEAIGELTALESLDLSENELRELPDSLWQLRGLRSLVLDGTRIWRR